MNLTRKGFIASLLGLFVAPFVKLKKEPEPSIHDLSNGYPEWEWDEKTRTLWIKAGVYDLREPIPPYWSVKGYSGKRV